MTDDLSARLVGAGFVGAGVAHFARPDFFESIVPRWFPDPTLANRASGAAELVLGAAMFPRRTRRAAAWGLIGVVAAVYPANVDMFLNDVDVGRDDRGRVHRVEGADGVRVRNAVRLPVQFVFVWLLRRHTRREDISS